MVLHSEGATAPKSNMEVRAMKIVDASFIASYSRRISEKPEKVIEILDSKDTVFVLVKPSPVYKGKVIYARDLEESSALAFEEFARKQGNATLLTDEVKVVEGCLITGVRGSIKMPPTRSGLTAASVLKKNVLVVPPVKYDSERRVLVNIKGALSLRNYIEANPDAKLIREEETAEPPAIVLSRDKNGIEKGIFYYKIVPIIGVHGERYPTKLIEKAISIAKELAGRTVCA